MHNLPLTQLQTRSPRQSSGYNKLVRLAGCLHEQAGVEHRQRRELPAPRPAPSERDSGISRNRPDAVYCEAEAVVQPTAFAYHEDPQ